MYMYMYIYVYVHTYNYIHTYVYTYVYVHIHTHNIRLRPVIFVWIRLCVCPCFLRVCACVLMCACAGASDALRGDAAAKGSPRESAQIYSPCFSCSTWHAAGIQDICVNNGANICICEEWREYRMYTCICQ